MYLPYKLSRVYIQTTIDRPMTVCGPYSETMLSVIVMSTFPLVSTTFPRSPTCLKRQHQRQISSSAVAERPRHASYLSVVGFNSTIRRVKSSVIMLLVLISASDLPLRTNKFCSVLFSTAYSLMRGDMCRKQTYTVIVIHYCTEDRQLSIAHCSSHLSIAIRP